ncbi:MAG: hypothetical protein J0M18_12170 [Ignavibacteria bacterium]|jgi:membrane-associated HD superfamily phosphohydrolase|nr:hypothetical protein [Ignavibacteria bacterium]
MNANLESEILFIKKIMNESRKSALDNGKYYILWGVLISVACFANYFNNKMSLDFNPNYFWGACILAGWVFSIFWGYKDSKKAKTYSAANKTISALWASLGIAMLVIVVAGKVSGSISYASISPLIAAVLGVGYFTSGVMYSDKMLKIMAFCWWGASVVMFNIKGEEVLLANGIFLVAFQVIPGLILFSKWKKELTVVEA